MTVPAHHHSSKEIMKGITIIVTAVVLALVGAQSAQAHWKPGIHNTLHAINWAFCHHSYKPCEYGRQATDVSWGETGGTFTIWASNGQYLGLFQMGSHERATYGHGNNAWAQSAAAYRYFAASGFDWSPWSCKPGRYCIN